ncbi:MAG: RNA-dependent DNA polymerase, partial [Candidatus Competibacteraceae bacterium]|nr:RNA-dependent DNA polymerase [Candidatus Competibacteraceae bacterium]
MKRLGNLWPQVIAFDNLYRAWRKARKGKSRSTAVVDFELGLEHHLLALQGELLNGIYQPGNYRLFTIYERKARVIAAAPFRDRVVHHALMNIIEPLLDRRFIFDCYACRAGKGTHAAVDRYQHWSRRYRYALKLDVRQYFPSIDREHLKAKLRARIKDRSVIELLDRIIDAGPNPNGKGIPIGNLTSQFFANLYLDDFDHWIKETLRAPAYLRYVDDMVLLSDDKRQLADWREHIRARLYQERLQLHPNKAHISPTRCGLNLLGYV